MVDLYDTEISALGRVVGKLMSEWSSKANTRSNLEELTRRTHDECLKIGLIVELDTTPCLIAQVDPASGRISYGSPELIVVGRSPHSRLATQEEGVQIVDHELKRAEIIQSKERGEDYSGQKFRSTL